MRLGIDNIGNAARISSASVTTHKPGRPEDFEDTMFKYRDHTSFGLDRGNVFIEVDTTSVGQASISGRRITLPDRPERALRAR
jgi:hypothetical protein